MTAISHPPQGNSTRAAIIAGASWFPDLDAHFPSGGAAGIIARPVSPSRSQGRSFCIRGVHDIQPDQWCCRSVITSLIKGASSTGGQIMTGALLAPARRSFIIPRLMDYYMPGSPPARRRVRFHGRCYVANVRQELRRGPRPCGGIDSTSTTMS